MAGVLNLHFERTKICGERSELRGVIGETEGTRESAAGNGGADFSRRRRRAAAEDSVRQREVGKSGEWGVAAGGSRGVRGFCFGEECREVVRENSASKNAVRKARREGG